jgi:tRNA-modifying protein YgfZ
MRFLADRQIIELSGNDRNIFLQNLITNDLNEIREKRILHTFFLNHLGKIIFEFYIHESSESLLIDCNKESTHELIKRLMLYKLRSKITIKIREDLGVYWTKSKLNFPLDPRNKKMGYRGINDKESISDQNKEPDYEQMRINLAIAEINKDFLSLNIFSHELNDYDKSISHIKGCYPGQEIVSRIYHKKVKSKRIFYPFRYSGKPGEMGDKISYQNREIGLLGSKSDKFILACVNRNLATASFYINNLELIKMEYIEK